MTKIEIEKEKIELCIQKTTCKKEIAKLLNISIKTLNRLLILYNITLPKYNWNKGKKEIYTNYKEVNKQWIQEHWIDSDKSLNQLSKEFNIPLSILENRAMRSGLTKSHKYKINTTKLFNKEDIVINYLAGLLNTDGYFRKDVDGFDLQLVGEDEKELLESIRDYLESTRPIYIYQNRFILNVNCDGVREFFSKEFNISVNNKTFETSVPKEFPNEECARAYVRGCLDGDGYIGKTIPRLSFLTASYQLVSGVADIIKTYTGISLKVRQECKRGTNSYPCINASRQQALKILNWVYGGDNSITLKRKYNNYLNYKIKR